MFNRLQVELYEHREALRHYEPLRICKYKNDPASEKKNSFAYYIIEYSLPENKRLCRAVSKETWESIDVPILYQKDNKSDV